MAVATVKRISIGGMTCAGCVATVENALKAVPGVSEASVNFAEHTASVSGDVPSAALVAAVRQAGYEAAELRGADDEQAKESAELNHYRTLLRKFIVAALVGVPLFVAEPLGWLPMLDMSGGRLFWLIIGGVFLLVCAFALSSTMGNSARSALDLAATNPAPNGAMAAAAPIAESAMPVQSLR